MGAGRSGSWRDRQSRRVSSVLILASLGTYVIVGLVTIYAHDWRTVETVAVGAALLGIPHALLRRGHHRLGNLILMVIAVASVTVLATVGQGIRDLALLAFPIIFIYVGLTSDRAMLVLCGVLTFLSLLWLALGQPLGWYAPVPLFPDPLNLFYLVVTTVLLVTTTLAVDLLSSNLRKSLDQSRQEIEERKRVEEALRVSEAKFRAVVENSHDGILFTDENAVIHYRSPSYRRINGFSNDERIGRSGLETVHPQDLDAVHRNWAALLADPKTPRTFSYRIRHKDGSWRWVETACLNLLHNPEVRSIVIASRDTTEHKQAEDALAASEERFRRMFERHSAAMIVIDPETGRLLEANQAASDFYGWSVDELTAMSIQDINTMSAEAVRREMETVRSLGRTRFSFRHRRADGSARDVEVFSSSIELRGKAVLYSIVHDVTEQRKAEALLRQGEERYRLMFEYAPLAIVISRGTDVVYANPSCLKMLGLSCLEDLRRMPPLELFAPEARPQIQENMVRRFQGPSVPASYETVCLRRDGTRFPILLYLAQAEFADGPAMLAFILDISERKRAEEEQARLQDQLTQAQKMESVGRLAGGVAHDFNNMLGVILGHTDMALQQVPPEQPLRDSLEEIRKASNHSADLTRQLLAFAR
ncbi:MAG TPA: PAS domain S-box protein, partial [Spirochaetia bacterium]|nr:PAS domain S-box protein [Spirochaetia bacterium]